MVEHIQYPTQQLVYPENFNRLLKIFTQTTIEPHNVPIFVSQLRYEAEQRGLGNTLNAHSLNVKGLYHQLWLSMFLERIHRFLPGYTHWDARTSTVSPPYRAHTAIDGTVHFLQSTRHIAEFDGMTVYEDPSSQKPPFYTIWEIKASQNQSYVNQAYKQDLWMNRVNLVKSALNTSQVGYVVVSTTKTSTTTGSLGATYRENGGKVVRLPAIFNTLLDVESQFTEWELNNHVPLPIEFTMDI